MNAKNLTGLLCSMLTAFIIMSCDGGGNDDTDTDAPDAPVITSPVNGATINFSTVTISGTAEAGSTVELFDMNDTAPIGTAKADFNGDWSLTISPLADGVHNLTATATDAACNTSSPSTALIISVDTTLPGYADIPKLDCNTLLTIDDIDEALAYWDRPVDERDTYDIEKGEVCRTYIYSDERVYVQIEPGSPADFFPATKLLDAYGEPVSGVGDDARWFFGTGSAGGTTCCAPSSKRRKRTLDLCCPLPKPLSEGFLSAGGCKTRLLGEPVCSSSRCDGRFDPIRC